MEGTRKQKNPEAGSTLDAVEAAITSRRSVRGFLSTPVSSETVRRIIRTASRAASGNNTQPWFVRVVTGQAKQNLSDEILREFYDPELAPNAVAEFNSYPTEWKAPYKDRRREVGVTMYTLLGIPKGDRKAMQDQAARNFTFFDAPVGLIFSMDRVFVPGAAIDLGMFMGNITTLARAHGLDTCPQAAFGIQHSIVRRVLDIPENEVVMCGMALGHADRGAPLDAMVTSRLDLEEYVTEYE